MDTQVSQRVNKLYQQLNVLQEFIELKFGKNIYYYFIYFRDKYIFKSISFLNSKTGSQSS